MPHPYRHILLAVDLAPDTAAVAARARDPLSPDTRLSIIHVIEPLALAYGAEMPIDLGTLQEEITKQARTRLETLAREIGDGRADTVMASGSVPKEILRAADELGVDLIVIGSHGRRGLAALLGATANGVLHHAHCDVLAVRIAMPGKTAGK